MNKNTEKNIKKILIYPYNNEINPLLYFNNLIVSKYKISSLISPRGWNYHDNNIFIDNEEIKINTSLDEIDEEVEIIIIPNYNMNEQFDYNLITSIMKLNKIKKIICDKMYNEYHLNILKSYCNNNNIEFLYQYYRQDLPCEELELYKITVPIIAVSGIDSNTNKFHVSLALREKFTKNGYNVSHISTRSYSQLINAHPFPDFMFDSKMEEIKKVYYLNNYINDVIRNDKPDVLIITIPGAIENIMSDFPSGFGILQYITFKAFTVDYMIVCTFFDYNNVEFLNKISDLCFYKFGSRVDCFHMSDYYIDYTTSKELNTIVSNNVGTQLVNNFIKEGFSNSKIPVYNLLEDSKVDDVYKLIINKLSD